MTQQTLVYPVIFAEFHDDGHYFTVTSPNIPGMVTDGTTRAEAATEAVDAIDGEPYPAPQDPSSWALEPNESIVYISVDMAQWYREKARWQQTKNRSAHHHRAAIPE